MSTNDETPTAEPACIICREPGRPVDCCEDGPVFCSRHLLEHTRVAHAGRGEREGPGHGEPGGSEPIFSYTYSGEGDPRDTEDLRERIRSARVYFGKFAPKGPVDSMSSWPLLAAMLVVMDWLDAELAEERAPLDIETARAVLDEATGGRPDFEGFVQKLEGEAKWVLDIHADDDATGLTQAKSDADTLTRLAERVRAAGRSGGYL